MSDFYRCTYLSPALVGRRIRSETAEHQASERPGEEETAGEGRDGGRKATGGN